MVYIVAVFVNFCPLCIQMATKNEYYRENWHNHHIEGAANDYKKHNEVYIHNGKSWG